jgi:hypothetical protein
MDWWRNLPAFVRIPIALVVLFLATGAFLAGLRAGIGLFAVGLILLMTGPSDARKKGYHDF